MGIALADDLLALADVAHSFASSRGLRAESRALLDADSGSAPESWAAMAELGWPGLHLPEGVGGAGAGLPAVAVVAEALGAAVAPGPLLPSIVASAVLHDLDPGAAQLPGLADGTVAGAFGRGDDLRIDGDRISGTATVIGAAWADLLVLLVGADVAVVNLPCDTAEVGACAEALDPSTGLGVVALDGAPAEVHRGGGAAALAIARTVFAAEAAGGARATLDLALGYAKVREQFGRTIGSFQAIKHHLADMLVNTERATAVAWDAAEAFDAGADQSRIAAAAAAIGALTGYLRNAELNIQVHGGIGFTWEHDAHLYLRRARTLAALLDLDGAAGELFDLTAAGLRRQYDVALPPDAEQYRTQAAEIVAQLAVADAAARRELLVDSGYLVPHWPTPWGRGATAIEQLVIEQEFADTEVPALGIGGWVLLTMIQHGSSEQIERWARASLLGELTWCQLFSEPQAGSDAAAVQTRGVRVDGGWRITGQKVWTSNAQSCNRGLATVRTDSSAAKHRGITTMAVDLHADGVDIRPLREITGHALFNEVFFDDVFVPDSDVVGAVDDGWTVARATLGNERVSIGGAKAFGSTAFDLVRAAVQTDVAPSLRTAVGQAVAEEHAIRVLNLRAITRAVIGAGPGVEGNLTKLLVALQAQRVADLGMRVVGLAGVNGGQPQWTFDVLASPAMTIAGGTSEITRNVIAERLLGLPRDPLNT